MRCEWVSAQEEREELRAVNKYLLALGQSHLEEISSSLTPSPNCCAHSPLRSVEGPVDHTVACDQPSMGIIIIDEPTSSPPSSRQNSIFTPSPYKYLKRTKVTS